MKVKVTQEHIKNAVRKDSHRCMIADAIRAQHPEAKYICVDLQAVQWSDLDKGIRYKAFTPPKAQLRLLAFDQGKPVEPFRMTVTPVQTRKVGWQGDPEVLKRIRQRAKAGTSKPTKRKHYRPRKERQFGIRMFVEA